MPKTVFLMLMRNEHLAGLQAHFEDRTNILTIRKDGEVTAQGNLETAEGRTAIEQFFVANFAGDLKGPPKVLASEGHSFSDVAKKVVSIINLESLKAIETMVAPFIRCASAPICTSWAGRHGTRLIFSAKRSPLARRG